MEFAKDTLGDLNNYPEVKVTDAQTASTSTSWFNIPQDLGRSRESIEKLASVGIDLMSESKKQMLIATAGAEEVCTAVKSAVQTVAKTFDRIGDSSDILSRTVDQTGRVTQESIRNTMHSYQSLADVMKDTSKDVSKTANSFTEVAEKISRILDDSGERLDFIVDIVSFIYDIFNAARLRLYSSIPTLVQRFLKLIGIPVSVILQSVSKLIKMDLQPPAEGSEGRTRVIPEGNDGATGIQALVTLIVGTIGTGILGQYDEKKVKSVETKLRLMSTLQNISGGVFKALTFCLQSLPEVVKEFVSYILPKSLQFTLVPNGPAQKFMEKVNELERDGFEGSLYSNRESRKKAELLYEEAYQIATDIAVDKEKEISQRVVNLFNIYFKKVADWAGKARKCSGMTAVRRRPFVMHLFGESGIGKTTFATWFGQLLSPPGKNFSNVPYIRTYTTHWDDYNQNPVVIYPDFEILINQTQDSQVAEFMGLADPCPYILPMASLNEKGMGFMSDTIILCSNIATPDVSANVRYDTAFRRRRHVLVEMRLVANCAHVRQTPHTQERMLADGAPLISDYSHLEFRFHDPMCSTNPGDESVLPAHPRWMGINEFLDVIIPLHSEHLVREYSLVEMNQLTNENAESKYRMILERATGKKTAVKDFGSGRLQAYIVPEMVDDDAIEEKDPLRKSRLFRELMIRRHGNDIEKNMTPDQLRSRFLNLAAELIVMRKTFIKHGGKILEDIANRLSLDMSADEFFRALDFYKDCEHSERTTQYYNAFYKSPIQTDRVSSVDELRKRQQDSGFCQDIHLVVKSEHESAYAKWFNEHPIIKKICEAAAFIGVVATLVGAFGLAGCVGNKIGKAVLRGSANLTRYLANLIFADKATILERLKWFRKKFSLNREEITQDNLDAKLEQTVDEAKLSVSSVEFANILRMDHPFPGEIVPEISGDSKTPRRAGKRIRSVRTVKVVPQMTGDVEELKKVVSDLIFMAVLNGVESTVSPSGYIEIMLLAKNICVDFRDDTVDFELEFPEVFSRISKWLVDRITQDARKFAKYDKSYSLTRVMEKWVYAWSGMNIGDYEFPISVLKIPLIETTQITSEIGCGFSKQAIREDKVLNDYIENKYCKNQFCIHRPLEKGTNSIPFLNGTFISGSIALIPFHFFLQKINGELLVEGTPLTIFENGKVTHVPFEKQNLRRVYMSDDDGDSIDGDNSDIALYDFGIAVHPHSNIIKCFVSEDDLAKAQDGHAVMTGYLSSIGSDNPQFECDNIVVSPLNRNHIGREAVAVYPLATLAPNKREICVTMGYKFEGRTRGGYCGAIVSMVNPSLQPGKIIGYHVGSLKSLEKEIGYIILVTRERLQKVFETFDKGFSGDVYPSNILPEVGILHPIGESFLHLGKLPPGKVPRLPMRSDLIHSPIYGKYKKTEMGPAVLSIHDKRMVNTDQSPLLTAMSAAGPAPGILNPRIKKAVEKHFYRKILSMESPIPRRPLTIDEAINGVPPFIEPLNMTTSAGYPCNLSCNHKQGGKRDFFDGFQDDPNVPTVYTFRKGGMVEQMYQRHLEKAEKMEYDNEIFVVDTLKDEKVPLAKVRDGKTRLFNMFSVSYNLLAKRYLAPIIAHMSYNRPYAGITTGANYRSKEFHHFVLYLKSKGDFGFAGDEKKCDKRHFADTIAGVYELAKEFYQLEKYSKEWKELEFCKVHAVHNIHIFLNSVYLISHINCSGIFGTTFINDYKINLCMRMAYTELAIKAGYPHFMPEHFDDTCIVVTCGDDHIVVVGDPEVQKFFNACTYRDWAAPLGITYTHTDKEQELQPIYRIDEMSFCKCEIGRLNGRYVPLLNMLSIEESTNWIRETPDKSFASYVDALNQSLDDASRSLFFYGREKYNQWESKLRKIAIENRIELKIPDFDMLKHWYEYGEKDGLPRTTKLYIRPEMNNDLDFVTDRNVVDNTTYADHILHPHPPPDEMVFAYRNFMLMFTAMEVFKYKTGGLEYGPFRYMEMARFQFQTKFPQLAAPTDIELSKAAKVSEFVQTSYSYDNDSFYEMVRAGVQSGKRLYGMANPPHNSSTIGRGLPVFPDKKVGIYSSDRWDDDDLHNDEHRLVNRREALLFWKCLIPLLSEYGRQHTEMAIEEMVIYYWGIIFEKFSESKFFTGLYDIREESFNILVRQNPRLPIFHEFVWRETTDLEYQLSRHGITDKAEKLRRIRERILIELHKIEYRETHDQYGFFPVRFMETFAPRTATPQLDQILSEYGNIEYRNPGGVVNVEHILVEMNDAPMDNLELIGATKFVTETSDWDAAFSEAEPDKGYTMTTVPIDDFVISLSRKHRMPNNIRSLRDDLQNANYTNGIDAFREFIKTKHRWAVVYIRSRKIGRLYEVLFYIGYSYCEMKYKFEFLDYNTVYSFESYFPIFIARLRNALHYDDEGNNRGFDMVREEFERFHIRGDTVQQKLNNLFDIVFSKRVVPGYTDFWAFIEPIIKMVVNPLKNKLVALNEIAQKARNKRVGIQYNWSSIPMILKYVGTRHIVTLGVDIQYMDQKISFELRSGISVSLAEGKMETAKQLIDIFSIGAFGK